MVRSHEETHTQKKLCLLRCGTSKKRTIVSEGGKIMFSENDTSILAIIDHFSSTAFPHNKPVFKKLGSKDQKIKIKKLGLYAIWC